MAVDANAEVAFSEAMAASSIGDSTFTLTRVGSTTGVEATVGYDTATR